MTRNPITIPIAMTVTEAQALMRQEKVHRFPVLDKKRNMVGIVTEKDLLYASPSVATSLNIWEANYLLSKLTVEKVMTKEVITVNEDTPIEDAARIMVDNNIGGLPVMRDSIVVGIITESNLFSIFIELFGARMKGIRFTFLAPQKRGELAQIASAIAAKGGNIISVGSFLGEDSSNCLITIKVEDVSKDDLLSILKPLITKIVDIREV